MSWAAPVAMVGSAVAKGVSGYQQGKAQANAAAQQQRAAEVRALEVETSRRDELVRTLSSFRAARGANGLSLTSPTAQAYADDLRVYARRDYLNEVKAVQQQAAAYGATAQAARSSAGLSLVTGALGAAAPLGTIAQDKGWI